MNRLYAHFNNKYSQRHREFDFDFIAPVAVVFLLLTFVIFRSDFAPIPGVIILLPQAESVTYHGGADSMLVVVDKQGRYFFRHQIVDKKTLISRLQRTRDITSPNSPLIVRADHSLELGTLTRIHDICRLAGISNLVLEVDASKKGNQSAHVGGQ